MVFQASFRPELLPRPAAPPTPPEPVTVFHVPFRQKVNFGDGRTIRIVSTSRIVLEIDGDGGGTFTVANNHFTWRGYQIRAMVEKGGVDLTLPERLAVELGIAEAALVPV